MAAGTDVPATVTTTPARTDTVRRHNLALVLRQVHLHGALTRSQLTQRSGLHRSTIRGLVTELSDLSLVRDSVPVGGTRLGRPSHVVEPRSDGPFVVAVDVDPEQVTTAAVGIGGRVLARHVVTTARPAEPPDVARYISQAIPLLRQGGPGPARLVGIGISLPGTVNARTGVVGLAPNLGWHDVSFGRLMAALAPAGVPVTVGNDADLAVLAEHRRGSARGYDDVIYLFGRSGVGAGILVAGRALRGTGGLAGEIGHTVLDPSGLPCHCGGRGCVETFISDAALLRLAGPPPAGQDATTSSGTRVQHVLAAAAAGEPKARHAIHTLAGHLGRVVANLVNLLNPQLIVMGGLLRDVLILARPHVEATLERHALPSALAMAELRPSRLGPNSSLLGAAELAFGPLLADPSSAHDTTTNVSPVRQPLAHGTEAARR